MKKALVAGIFLLLATLQPFPAWAVLVNSWGGFTTAWNFWPAFGVPLQVNANLNAPGGTTNLGTWSAFGTSVWLDGYTINGSGADTVFWVNKDCPLYIVGGEIDNSNSTTHTTIVNHGTLTLSDVTLQNGVNQTDSSYPGTTLFGANNSQQGGTVYLNGNSNFTVGSVAFAPGTKRTDVYFNGGVITNAVAIGIDGSMNYFHITGGSVTYAPVASWNWGMGAGITLSGTGTLTLENITHNTLNTSDQSGNSTYSQTGGTLNLTNGSNLALNDSGSGITGGTVNIGSSSGTGNTLTAGNGSTIGSGATVNLYSGNTLNVSGGTVTLSGAGGANDLWAGAVNLSAGSLTLNGITAQGVLNMTGGNLFNNADSTISLLNGNCRFTGGAVVNNGTLDLTASTSQTFGASLSGNGAIYVNGSGTILFTGSNSGYTGDLFVNGGHAQFSNAQSYITGDTHVSGGSLYLLFGDHSRFNSHVDLSNNALLILDTGPYNVTTTSTGTLLGSPGESLVKEGSGSYTYRAENPAFNFKLLVNEGLVNIISDSVHFNGAVSVGKGAGYPVAYLGIDAGIVSFNNGLTLSNGYLGLRAGGFDVTAGGLTVGSTIDTMNRVVATNHIAGNLNVGASGTGEFLIDVSPGTGTSDKYKISGNITTTNPGGVIDVAGFNVVGPLTEARKVNLKLFDAAGTIDPSIVFTGTGKLATSPLAKYGLASLGNGSYDLNWEGYNPLVFRGQAAIESAYLNQLTTNNVVFDHIGLGIQESKLDGYVPFSPDRDQSDRKYGGFWLKSYGNLERMHLSQDIDTKSHMWGTLFGVDLPAAEPAQGWKLMPTAYFGFADEYQTYSGVDMHQHVYQFGVMGTLYYGKAMSSLLVNSGWLDNSMSFPGATDDASSWFMGIASKSAYNFNLTGNLVLQPNLLFSYNLFGKQTWDSAYGDNSLTSGALNGFNVVPGLNLILNRNTWSVYATTRGVFNVMNGSSGTIDHISLPAVKMGTAYAEYGVGFTKRVQDRFSVYGETVFSGGEKNGAGFQGGMELRF